MQHYAYKQKMHGISLVELLVGMAVGLIISLGIIQIYTMSIADKRLVEGYAQLQENGRFSMEFLTGDLRMAGYTGCSSNGLVANTINHTGEWQYDFEHPLYGYEGGVSTFPAEIPANSNTDAIVVMRGADGDYFIDNHNPSSANIYLTEDHDLKDGEILLISDCSNGQSGIFQNTKTNNNNTNIVIHNTGNSTPGNCTKALGGNGDCGDSAALTNHEYGPESRIMKFVVHAYYIANNTAIPPKPSLYRVRLTQSGGGAATVAEELVEGVEDMQILYGVDTDTPTDGVADIYQKANQVTAAQWTDKRIASVRIALLASTPDDQAPKPQKYSFNGTTYDGGAATGHAALPTDSKLRREFVTTVKVRNLGL